MMTRRENLILGAYTALALFTGQTRGLMGQARGRTGNRTLIPDARWNCGMPGGIPTPEAGTLAFEVEVPLQSAVDIGKTPYGRRRIAVGDGGSVKGAKLTATVMPGALDYELVLANGGIEIEQMIVLRSEDGSYIYIHNAGVGPNAGDVRVVVDIEAPNASANASLNTGRYLARRELNASARKLSLRVYDATAIPADAASAIKIVKPDGVPAQPWDRRRKGATEKQGETLVHENVTLGKSQMVGASKRGIRNIVPITGGELSGQITGKVLMGGADYQHLSPPAIIDARYLWQAADGEVIMVRNAGPFGALVPTFEARVDGPYAFLNKGLYLSSNPGMGQGGVGLTLYKSTS